MYYVLTCPAEPHETISDFFPDDRYDESWYTGEKLAEPPPDPLELVWDPENESGRRMSFYTAGTVLMTKELVAALAEAGVRNLDVYPAVIRSKGKKSSKAKAKASPKTNAPAGDCHDYLAVNVIGVIKAVDKKKSVILSDDGGSDMLFESLVIDEKKAKGQPLFRLGESVSAVIIHETVVKHLKKKGGFGLTFLDPADFVG